MGEAKYGESLPPADFFKGQWEAMVKRRGNSPAAAVLEVISGCSAGTCSHCYASATPGRGIEMSVELASTILKGLSRANTPPKEIWPTGGEPGLYHNLPEVSKIASDLGFSVCIVTNGEPFADMKT
ncbi:MAG: radical SAM protein, partial [bacterium]|nr:radical SAM protein [bacterium]